MLISNGYTIKGDVEEATKNVKARWKRIKGRCRGVKGRRESATESLPCDGSMATQ